MKPIQKDKNPKKKQLGIKGYQNPPGEKNQKRKSEEKEVQRKGKGMVEQDDPDYIQGKKQEEKNYR